MIRLLLSLVLFVGMETAFAHGNEGHSGAAVVCRDAKGGILSAQLLDLWEARLPRPLGFALPITRHTADYQQQITRALERLRAANPAFADEVEAELKPLEDSQFLVPSDLRLAVGTDSDPLVLPKGCQLEQLAIFRDGTLFLDPNLFGSLVSETDRAALYLHEAIYRIYRETYSALRFRTREGKASLGDSSRIARRAVGFLFSDRPAVPVLRDIAPGAMKCSGKFFEFYVDGGAIHFTRLGVPVLTMTTAAGDSAPIETAFSLLGDKVGFRFSRPSASHGGSAETTGGILEIPPDALQCSQ